MPVEPNGAPATASPNESRRNFILALCGLAVASFGGVPGLLAVKNYLDRSSVQIIFDQKESARCIIVNSPNSEMENKFAILLYGVTLVGKGAEHFVVRDVAVSIRAPNGTWHPGKRFAPVQRESRDRNGPTPPVIRLYVGVRKPIEEKRPANEEKRAANGKVDLGDTIMLGDWRDFSPGFKLGFGEPSTLFMVATYFPTVPPDAKGFDWMRVVVSDYLGNVYDEDYQTSRLKNVPYTLYLDQSPP